MENLEHIPLKHMPASFTHAGIVLSVLADGEKHTTQDLLMALNCVSPRGGLQKLQNEYYGFWLIHNLGGNGAHEGIYQLDDRHFTGDLKDDEAARLDRQIELANIRNKQAA